MISGLTQEIEITLLLPCLNEARTLGGCLAKARRWIEASGVKAEMVVADNGSTDDSQRIAECHGARVVAVPEPGYGSALYGGCRAARGRYIIMGDSDDSYDFSQLDDFLAKLREGYDLVMGNRFQGGIRPGAMPWKNRYIGNPALTFIGRVLFRAPCGDFHCGLRALTRDAFERLDLRTTGMEFASEMVIKAALFGLKIAEVPTVLYPDGRGRPPHLHPWRDGWRHLRFMLLFSPRWIFLVPGLVLMVLCGVLYVRLLWGDVVLGSITFSGHSLWFMLAGLLLGYLNCLLWLTTRLVGVTMGLLPPRRYLAGLTGAPVLEIGGLVGLAALLGGLGLGVWCLIQWGRQSFGPLEAYALMPPVSLSILGFLIGGITLAFSMVLGFILLPRRRA